MGQDLKSGASSGADHGDAAMSKSRPDAGPGTRCDVGVVHTDGSAVLTVRGEIDMETAPMFYSGVVEATQAAHRLVVDLRRCTFMDSTGLAVLANAYRRLGQSSEAIVVHATNGVVRRALAVSGVDELVTVVDGDRGSPGAHRSATN
jgi:anti-anti-sigma factor